ncbi:MAG: hypothetical protein QOG90_360 [Actinomycetota bacterium]|jgi:hypothetical protein
MLPANRDDRTVHVHRNLDVDEEDLLDAITLFAADQDLEVDRRHEGPGLLFVRTKESTAESHVFKRGDSLRVVITDTGHGHDIEFDADLRASIDRKSHDRSRRVLRGYAVGAFFAVLGARGLLHGVDFGDFVLLAIGAGFGRRAFGRAQSASDGLDDLQRKVANELNRVCDEAELA